MNARERLVVRVLLLVARICAEDDHLKTEIKHLANHIDLHGPKDAPQ